MPGMAWLTRMMLGMKLTCIDLEVHTRSVVPGATLHESTGRRRVEQGQLK